MTIKHVTMGLVVVAGFFTAMLTSRLTSAQSVVQWNNRFTVADVSIFDGGGKAYVLHDHKNYASMPRGVDVCFLIVEGSNGGVFSTPRMC